jgi:uncharacterized SAM-binding protein YcdF (DUF218 family)
VLVSGRQPDLGASGQTLAELMRDFLIQLGVPVADLIVEKNALTTYENAVECRKLLESRQIRKILLVTTASHLARAVSCFRQQGLEVIPCGCAYQTRFQLSLVESLPSLKAAVKSRRACHEWVGLAWYAMHGRR